MIKLMSPPADIARIAAPPHAQTQKLVVGITVAWLMIFVRVWQRKQKVAAMRARRDAVRQKKQ